MVRKTNRKISAYASADIWTSLRWRKLSAILQRIRHRHVTYTATNCQQAQVPAAPGYRRNSLLPTVSRLLSWEVRTTAKLRAAAASHFCVCVCVGLKVGRNCESFAWVACFDAHFLQIYVMESWSRPTNGSCVRFARLYWVYVFVCISSCESKVIIRIINT